MSTDQHAARLPDAERYRPEGAIEELLLSDPLASRALADQGKRAPNRGIGVPR